MPQPLRVAGIMSGTSLDGIDVAIADITWPKGKKPKIELLATSTSPYSKKLRSRLLAVSNTDCHTRDVARLHYELPELYAQAVEATCLVANLPLDSLHLVGCHGQTVYHEGATATLQLGEPSILAARLGTNVVANFRAADIAAGGQGAPLVPFFDWLLLTHPKRHRVALNLGGIANLHLLPANASAGQVLAFDSGPGNMVLDQLAPPFDKNARRASRGTPNQKLLNQLLRDPYYLAPPPKSCGREQFGEAFLAKLRKSNLSTEDLLATATLFTAATVVIGIQHHIVPRNPVDEVIASGGGIHNPLLMRFLQELLGPIPLLTTESLGIPTDHKEALAFALLAAAHHYGIPANLPASTGAQRPVLLGQLAPAP
ncbi:MAG: anhydro-N-acetylmuramic acid kinase [Bryobacter sp.]|nr:anhydro-N-acetylmuramic acid kinase [Bryobacter sp.]